MGTLCSVGGQLQSTGSKGNVGIVEVSRTTADAKRLLLPKVITFSSILILCAAKSSKTHHHHRHCRHFCNWLSCKRTTFKKKKRAYIESIFEKSRTQFFSFLTNKIMEKKKERKKERK
jgi:hypothetical protein